MNNFILRDALKKRKKLTGKFMSQKIGRAHV